MSEHKSLWDSLPTEVQDALRRVEREASTARSLATGPWGQGQFTGDPSRLAVQVRHERFAEHAQKILAALAEIGVPGVE